MHQRVSKGANGALKNSLKNLSWKSYIIIQNSDKGNPIVTVDRDKYIKTTQKFLIDQSKVQKMLLKDNDFLSLIISQEKFIDKMYTKIPDSNSMSDKTQRYLEPVGTRPIIIYGSCKVCKIMLMAIHLSDRFYMLYKHLHMSLQSFQCHFRAIN